MLSYKKSEIRLIEIQEKLCRDVERGQKQVSKKLQWYFLF